MAKDPKKPRKKTRREHVGNLPPRYALMLNPFPETRLSSCPKCDRLTYPRKFPLFIHVEGWGPLIQGKTCKYCPRCELIMCHQDELEHELAHSFGRLKPEVIGNEYFLVGTVERKTWKAGMEKPGTIGDVLDHTADFKRYVDLQFDPGGWRHADAGPRYLEPRPPDTPWRRAREERGLGPGRPPVP